MKVELLSPAGSFDGVRAAVNAGADAVYAGGEAFGARAYAKNLSEDETERAIDFVHVRDRRIYFTLNTLIKDGELDRLCCFAQRLYECGADGVIVSDIGAISLIRKNFPELRVHASTQLAATGERTINALADAGVSRVVLPREMSLSDIRHIKEKTGVELECFVHGALCFCYSGKCLLSSFIGGRSGNRGRCAQPCRLEYKTGDGERKRALSPKDLCALCLLPQIIGAGVDSLKIEGRMKKPEYAAGVTAIYRKYIDMFLEDGAEGYDVSDGDLKALRDLFSRDGFCEGHLKSPLEASGMAYGKPQFRGENRELLAQIRKKYIDNDVKKDVYMCFEARAGMPFVLEASCRASAKDGTDKVATATAVGPVPDPARTAPADADSVKRQLLKTGGTPFEAEKIDVSIDDGLFITAGALNGARREVLLRLEEELAASFKKSAESRGGAREVLCNDAGKVGGLPREGIRLTCLVFDARQIDAVIRGAMDAGGSVPDVIYVEWSAISRADVRMIAKKIHRCGARFFAALPRVADPEAIRALERLDFLFGPDIDGYLIRDIEELFYLREKSVIKKDPFAGGNAWKDFVIDWSVHSFNAVSREILKKTGAERITAPLELNKRELKKRGCAGDEIVAYGKTALMVTKCCADKKNAGGFSHLTDRTGAVMPEWTDGIVRQRMIFNSVPICLLSKSDEVRELGFGTVRLEFSDEPAGGIIDITRRFTIQYTDNMSVGEPEKFTRGHFERGVM